MALVLTQPLTEISTSHISWRLRHPVSTDKSLLLLCADCLEIWEPQLPGTLGACPGP
jgi:hypothetical protein